MASEPLLIRYAIVYASTGYSERGYCTGTIKITTGTSIAADESDFAGDDSEVDKSPATLQGGHSATPTERILSDESDSGTAAGPFTAFFNQPDDSMAFYRFAGNPQLETDQLNNQGPIAFDYNGFPYSEMPTECRPHFAPDGTQYCNDPVPVESDHSATPTESIASDKSDSGTAAVRSMALNEPDNGMASDESAPSVASPESMAFSAPGSSTAFNERDSGMAFDEPDSGTAVVESMASNEPGSGMASHEFGSGTAVPAAGLDMTSDEAALDMPFDREISVVSDPGTGSAIADPRHKQVPCIARVRWRGFGRVLDLHFTADYDAENDWLSNFVYQREESGAEHGYIDPGIETCGVDDEGFQMLKATGFFHDVRTIDNFPRCAELYAKRSEAPNPHLSEEEVQRMGFMDEHHLNLQWGLEEAIQRRLREDTRKDDSDEGYADW